MVIVVYSSAVSCEATYLLTEREKIQMQSPESTGVAPKLTNRQRNVLKSVSKFSV